MLVRRVISALGWDVYLYPGCIEERLIYKISVYSLDSEKILAWVRNSSGLPCNYCLKGEPRRNYG
jgi:hypothetical protein